MASGGARARSGPAADPNSGRSEKRGVAAAGPNGLTLLPAEGRKGRAPAYPLPKITRQVVELVDGKPLRTVSATATNAFRKRELEVWRELWKTPQAAQWEREVWRWSSIAEYTRLRVVTEAEPDASASLLSRQREYRIELGLTPDGLKINGWAIAQDQVAAKATARPAAAKSERPAPSRRLRAVK